MNNATRDNRLGLRTARARRVSQETEIHRFFVNPRILGLGLLQFCTQGKNRRRWSRQFRRRRGFQATPDNRGREPADQRSACELRSARADIRGHLRQILTRPSPGTYPAPPLYYRPALFSFAGRARGAQRRRPKAHATSTH